MRYKNKKTLLDTTTGEECLTAKESKESADDSQRKKKMAFYENKRQWRRTQINKLNYPFPG